jgi:hypothetical protein
MRIVSTAVLLTMGMSVTAWANPDTQACVDCSLSMLGFASDLLESGSGGRKALTLAKLRVRRN